MVSHGGDGRESRVSQEPNHPSWKTWNIHFFRKKKRWFYPPLSPQPHCRGVFTTEWSPFEKKRSIFIRINRPLIPALTFVFASFYILTFLCELSKKAWSWRPRPNSRHVLHTVGHTYLQRSSECQYLRLTVILAFATLGTLEDSAISGSSTLGTPEDSAIIACSTLATQYFKRTRTRKSMTKSRGLELGLGRPLQIFFTLP